jgi:hypothetical protein
MRRFVDRTDPPQYRYSDDFEDIIAPKNANLDPSFLRRALSREGRYNSIYCGPSSEQTESSTKGIEKHVALTAAKMSKNMHLSNNDSKWSVDSSETDTDDMSDYNWVEKEVEVQDIIYRGKEIMTLVSYIMFLRCLTLILLIPRANESNLFHREYAPSPSIPLTRNREHYLHTYIRVVWASYTVLGAALIQSSAKGSILRRHQEHILTRTPLRFEMVLFRLIMILRYMSRGAQLRGSTGCHLYLMLCSPLH